MRGISPLRWLGGMRRSLRSDGERKSTRRNLDWIGAEGCRDIHACYKSSEKPIWSSSSRSPDALASSVPALVEAVSLFEERIHLIANVMTFALTWCASSPSQRHQQDDVRI